MLVGKKRKIGRRFEEIEIGEKLILTEKMEDKDLLLYLGLTNDSNPLYIQHDYVSQTPYEKPLVPNIMLTGIITSAVSKYLPGPGSYITKQNLSFLMPVYHYSMIQFFFEVIKREEGKKEVIVDVKALDEEENIVIQGEITVRPPYQLQAIDDNVLENF
ncbi:MaoC/PaaZ C-terminal domain-containing protein [Metabacillus fastidiosus]|uniref:MaoC/PaaZ C-terminal domain-containing protein n=1 Tax=Metabacillus fastidiosus TaxID=1458 RepID=UPI0008268619|nr:MaoC/PaaZ C-terminal domain-containing protein [Metabacillus fastidiosus]MED4464105.1 MaoC/PaaZ C-terminal domain-containing protein [Metabacillus fastidiosus]